MSRLLQLERLGGWACGCSGLVQGSFGACLALILQLTEEGAGRRVLGSLLPGAACTRIWQNRA